MPYLFFCIFNVYLKHAVNITLLLHALKVSFCLRYDQQPGPTHPSQQYRPTSQAGMMAPNQPGPEQMLGARYPGQQMPGMRPPHGGPQDQYPAQSYPAQGPGYTGPRPMMSQEGYPGYNGQQGSFPGPRPPMARDMTGGIYRTPNKHYAEMPPGEKTFSGFPLCSVSFCTGVEI